MIAQLKGTLSRKSPDAIVIDVNGVGYELIVSKKTLGGLPPEGDLVQFEVHTHLTEGSLSLYGFVTPSEKALFRRLISVSGIGPRSAMQILSGLTSQELVHAILNEDLIALTAINGIGKKTAERLIVELKDKVLQFSDKVFREADGLPSAGGKTYEEVLSALVNLGYQKTFAERALTGVAIRAESTFEEVLKSTLSALSK
ncbi:MAG: Holliday junction branch migration protein RuvA [Deltaproteobacteria bacterium]|nr:Holliday junction branch migration protein RuvA [Deltaproteobacteria bacterium]